MRDEQSLQPSLEVVLPVGVDVLRALLAVIVAIANLPGGARVREEVLSVAGGGAEPGLNDGDGRLGGNPQPPLGKPSPHGPRSAPRNPIHGRHSRPLQDGDVVGAGDYSFDVGGPQRERLLDLGLIGVPIVSALNATFDVI